MGEGHRSRHRGENLEQPGQTRGVGVRSKGHGQWQMSLKDRCQGTLERSGNRAQGEPEKESEAQRSEAPGSQAVPGPPGAQPPARVHGDGTGSKAPRGSRERRLQPLQGASGTVFRGMQSKAPCGAVLPGSRHRWRRTLLDRQRGEGTAMSPFPQAAGSMKG